VNFKLAYSFIQHCFWFYRLPFRKHPFDPETGPSIVPNILQVLLTQGFWDNTWDLLCLRTYAFALALAENTPLWINRSWV
jgi:hypothetical protein